MKWVAYFKWGGRESLAPRWRRRWLCKNVKQYTNSAWSKYFDLRVILQKRDNSPVTSNKMMYKTTDLQRFKIEKGK